MSHTAPAKTKPTKALVAAGVAFATTVAAGVEELIPDPTVQLVCQLVTLVAGAVTGAIAVYQTTNKPA